MLMYRMTRNGTWAVFGPQRDVHPGTVTVTKKDGSTKQETITHVSKPFDVDGTPYVYGFLDPQDRRNRPRHGRQCACEEQGCCRPRCQCEPHCVCRGGNVFDCMG